MIIQIILGESATEGSPIKLLNSRNLSEFDFNVITKSIVEMLKENPSSLTNLELPNNLEQTGINTIYDIVSLKHYLKGQGLYLSLCWTDSDVIVESDRLVKVITRVYESNLPISVDYSFPMETPIDFIEIVSLLRNQYDIYDQDIFNVDPLQNLLDSVESTRAMGLPISELIDSIYTTLESLGFKIDVILT